MVSEAEIGKKAEDLLQRLHADQGGDTVEICRAFLDEFANDADVLYRMSFELATRSRFDEAHMFLQCCLSALGDDTDYCTLHGAVSLARGDHEDAVTFYSRAIGLGRKDENVFNDLGVALLELGRPLKAQAAFQSALDEQPEFAPAHVNMAQCLTVQSRLQEALHHMQKAVEISPGNPKYLRSLGLSLDGLGRFDEAISWLTKAVQANPGFAEGYNSLAIALSNAGRLHESLEAHRLTFQLQPDEPGAYRNLALSHASLGQFDEALALAEQATKMVPNLIDMRVLYAFIMERSGAVKEARNEIDEALKIDPRHIEALKMKGALLKKSGKYQELLQTQLDLLEIEPGSPSAVSEIVDAVLNLCAWKMAGPFIETLINLIEQNIRDEVPIGVCINNLQSLPLSYEFIARAAKATAKLDFEAMAATREACNFIFPNPNRSMPTSSRLRIGYLIPYVHFHSLPIILKEIVERHDRSKFEIFGYCTGKQSDSEFSREYVQAFDSFVFGNHSSRLVAEKIYQDGIDILVDIAGQTLENCMEVNALRPAPVIAHFLGYSITTGADYIDYLITDETYVPAEDAELGPETVVYLPDCFLATRHFEISENVTTRTDQGLPEEGVIFCNFNQPFKFEPEIFAVWMRILSNVPGSVMWFGDWGKDCQVNLISQAGEKGVEANRLIFSSLLEHADHLERLGRADLALDTFHHGGGVTTVDCLWAGVPVLSCAGTTPPSRLGKSILQAANMPELVAADLKDYEEMAISLGRDPATLNGLRQKLDGERLRSPLFDNDRYMQNLETAYEMIWRNRELPSNA